MRKSNAMLKKLLLCSAVLTVSFHAVHAQAVAPRADTTADDDDTTAEVQAVPDTMKKAHDLNAVEVRAIRASDLSPFAKTNLTKADIQKQNLGQDLPLLLQFTPSVITNSDAGTGIGYTGIHIRGTDPTRINVTFNGMPVNDPEEQATFFVDIPDIASSTSSIQIQRGVGTSTNGAGSFGGTISINNLQQMDSAGVIFNSSYGSFNTFKNTLVAGTGMLKGGWQFDVRLSKLSSDGYINRATTDLKSMQFTAGWTPNDRTSFHFLFMPGTEKTGQAWDGVPQDSLGSNRKYNDLGLKEDGTYYNNQTDNYTQNYYQLFADHKFGANITGHLGLFLTRGKGYYEEYKQGQNYSDYGLPNIVTPAGDTFSQTSLIRRLWLDNYYYGSVFSLMYNKNNTHLTLGGGWSQFENQHYGTVIWAQNGGVPDNFEWYRHDAQKNDLNIYAKAEQTIGSVTLFGDMQYRNVAYYINGFQDNPDLRPSVNYDFFNPKAGLTWRIKNDAVEQQKLYASVAVGNREPNHDDFEVDPSMLPKPETVYDGEAGYEISRRKWNAGVNLYYMYYHNQLVPTGQINDVGAYTQTNVAESYRAGIELQASIIATRWLKFYGNATFSQNKISNFTEYIDNYDSTAQRAVNHGTTDIAFSPNVISALTAAFTPFAPHNGNTFEVDITGKYVSKEYLDNTSNDGRAIQRYGFCNVLLRYGLKFRPFREVVATLALNNIFGQLYENNGYTYTYISGGAMSTSNAYFPQAGFNVLGGITVRF